MPSNVNVGGHSPPYFGTPIVIRAARISLMLLAAGWTGALSAQQMAPVNGRQFPLNQYSPPGMVAEWARQAGKVHPHYFQPVKVLDRKSVV